jgi:hypothetical protein
MEESDDRFKFLLAEAQKCCSSLGLPDDLLLKIYQSDSDWAFILKVDALLETAVRNVVTRSLKMDVMGKAVGADELEMFVSALPLNGNTSLMKLLRATGCPSDNCDFIEATRKLRNAFAHNIKQVDDSLLMVIQRRKDWSSLLKTLSAIEQYDEKEFVKMIEHEGNMLRFSILDETLRFLTLAYHIHIK